MLNIEVKLDELKNDYPVFYEFFKNTLKNSQSKYKDYKEKKYKCYYYIGFYMLPSQKNEEYYEKLRSLKWEDRLKEEYKKCRITITMVAGKFGLSDQTNEIAKTATPYIDEIVKRKIYFEQLNDPDSKIMNSIPDLDELKLRIEEEEKAQRTFMEMLNDKVGIKSEKELKPQERLKKLIENEDYENAEKLIKEHPELRKRGHKE